MSQIQILMTKYEGAGYTYVLPVFLLFYWYECEGAEEECPAYICNAGYEGCR
jgi:hypothetical protein